MKVCIREVEDLDVLEAYFGNEDNPVARPLDGLGAMHGKTLFQGHMSSLPDAHDLMVLGCIEYEVAVRIFDVANDEVELVVHKRYIDEGGGS